MVPDPPDSYVVLFKYLNFVCLFSAYCFPPRIPEGL